MIYQNDRFVGREPELDCLEDIYSSDSFELVAVTGPSGSGKTALVREFCRDRRAILFTASDTDRESNLSAFSRAVSKAMYRGLRSLVDFNSVEEALAFLRKLSERERLIVVLDSYDRLMGSNDAFSSGVCRVLSKTIRGGNIMVILTGSEAIRDQQFGVNLKSIELGRMRFSDVRGICPGYSERDMVLLYGVTGGNPSALKYIDPGKTLKDNIDSMYLHSDSPLFKGIPERFSALVRNPSQYYRILHALESGQIQLGEIVQRSGVTPSAACSTYLVSLMDLGVVEKKHPFGAMASRRSVYSIIDSSLAFWLKFISVNRSIIEFRYDDDIYNPIMADVDEFFAPVFTDICRQFISENGKYFDIAPLHYGEWWDGDDHIDIIVGDILTTMFCDCVFDDAPVDLRRLKYLISKADSINVIGARRYALFSRAGFTDQVVDHAEKHPEVTLVSLREICRY